VQLAGHCEQENARRVQPVLENGYPVSQIQKSRREPRRREGHEESREEDWPQNWPQKGAGRAKGMPFSLADKACLRSGLPWSPLCLRGFLGFWSWLKNDEN
jgi:hypothetical protein